MEVSCVRLPKSRTVVHASSTKNARAVLLWVGGGQKVWAYLTHCPHFSLPLDFEPGNVSCYCAQVLMCAHHSALFRFGDEQCIGGHAPAQLW
jgi:nitrite reductase/ring-hydroxylating ferredoxin subunit